MSMNSLTDAMAVLQEAEARLVEAMNRLADHITDPQAHEDIWAAIRELRETETIWTNAQIKNLVEDTIREHLDKTFDDAHPGFGEYQTAFDNRFEELMNAIHSVEQKVETFQAAHEADASTLAAQLQAIEDRYAPVLANLQNAYQIAKDAGNEELALTYFNAMGSTVDAKKDELLAAMAAYQGAH